MKMLSEIKLHRGAKHKNICELYPQKCHCDKIGIAIDGLIYNYLLGIGSILYM